MNPLEAELAELRGRVSRLEAQLAALSRPDKKSVPPMPVRSLDEAVPAASAGEAPPVIPLATPTRRPPPQPALGDKLRNVPSTVWIAGAGAVIFLIGAIYGLTVSIERGWISPAVRVTTGLLTGVMAGAVAMRLLFAGRRELGLTLLAVGVGTWTFALYFGAKSAHLFPLGLGFTGAAVATLLAGALAARIRSDGAMAVALATGLAAPLAFSSGTGSLAGLLTYFVALSAAQLAAHYATGTGGDWKISRVLGLAGIWLVSLAASPAARLGEPAWATAAAALLAAVGLTLAWLPRHPEEPEAPAVSSVVVLLAAAFTLWMVWNRARWDRELFAVVPVALAAVSLGLMAGARTCGTRK
ncbi:MAG: hypothetical protein C0518_14440, partial [Opitutus sp.]|nr:hypothetical protein [Opitutus sp.]